MADLIQYYGTGRRKSAIARVFLRPGSGKFTVNGKQFEEYFVTPAQRVAAKLPLGIADINETFDVLSTVKGAMTDDERQAFEAPILAKYESEGNPYYSTARLWDDGIIDPLDTRRAIAIGLDAAANAPLPTTH